MADAADKLAEMLTKAHAGEAPAVHDAVLAAGYSFGHVVATAHVAAGYFGVHESTIGKWIKEGCPILRKGAGRDTLYNIKDVIVWRLGVADADAAAAAAQDGGAMDRYRLARAGLAELELAAAEGVVCRRDDVEAACSAAARTFAACLNRLLTRLCQAEPTHEGDITRIVGEGMEHVKAALMEPPAKPAKTAKGAA